MMTTSNMKSIPALIRNSVMIIRRDRTGRPIPGRAASSVRGSHKPMSEMNVTPFIDVLLVLLIMMIIGLPAVLHKTEVDLPTGPGNPVDSISNTVFIDAADRVYWNGERVSRTQLRNTVMHLAALPDEPQLRFQPAPSASYNTSVQTIALIKEAGAGKFAFIGNHNHKDFAK